MQENIIEMINNKFSMRKLLYYFLVLSIIASIFTGCKKGDMDPFFSLYSRKHRVVGDWDINNWKDTKILVDNFGIATTIDIDLTGTNIKVDTTISNDDSLYTWNGVINEATYNFKKTGELNYVLDFTLTKNRNYTDDNTNITYDTTYTRSFRYVGSGTWNFLSKVDDYKNKERISMVWENLKYVIRFTRHIEITDDQGNPPTITNQQTYESREDNYANGEYTNVWALKELKEKEIIMDLNYDQLHTSAFTDTLGTKNSLRGTSEATLQPKPKQ